MDIHTLKIVAILMILTWYICDVLIGRKKECDPVVTWTMETTDQNLYTFNAPESYSLAMACEVAEKKYAKMLKRTRQHVATVYRKRED